MFEFRKCYIQLFLTVVFVSGCSAPTPDDANGKSDIIPPGPYEVKPNDDLSYISLHAYGDASLWYGLLNANPHIGKRRKFIVHPGETIQIPERSDLDTTLPKSIFPETLPAKYVIMPGDSLHFIAQGCYGNREMWIKIYEANADILSEEVKQDTRKITAGEQLHIPALDDQ